MLSLRECFLSSTPLRSGIFLRTFFGAEQKLPFTWRGLAGHLQ